MKQCTPLWREAALVLMALAHLPTLRVGTNEPNPGDVCFLAFPIQI